MFLILSFKFPPLRSKILEWTGHKDVKVLLNIYTHLDSQDNQKSIEKVNQFLA